jgi:hypothetical protein
MKHRKAARSDLDARSNSSPRRCGSGGNRSNNPSRLLVSCKIVSFITTELYDGIHRLGTPLPLKYPTPGAYPRAYGKRAPNSMPLGTPDSDVEWPATGWLISSFSFCHVPFKMPKRVAMVAMFACLAIAFLGIAAYAEWGFPHGPKFFTGEFQEVCQNDRRCRDVPVFECRRSAIMGHF